MRRAASTHHSEEVRLRQNQDVTPPRRSSFRSVVLALHTWLGLITGLYIVVVTLTGSVLVYRNELYAAFAPKPVFVEPAASALTEAQLEAHAAALFPDWRLRGVDIGDVPHQAAVALMFDDAQPVQRLLHPYTGADLGNAVPLGYRATSWLLDLHDNLLGGPTGRKVNGIGAIATILLCVTGAIVWWPGRQGWTRNMTFELRRGSTRLLTSVHKALGFWVFAFLLMWGVTGTYLAYQEMYGQFFDYVQPFDPDNPEERTVDRIQYWLAYLHFGRLGGRGISWCDRGLCNSITMGTWAVVALVPTILFVTGGLVWWRRRSRRTEGPL